MTSKPRIYCAYLYSDGHAVIAYEKEDKHAGRIQYCEVIEKYGPACSFEGRLVFSNARYSMEFEFIKNATRVRVDLPSVERGSDNTKELGIVVGGLSAEFKDGRHFSITTFPNLISGPFTYQPNNREVFNPEAVRWSDMRISKIHRAKV